jgi:tripartite-type tricarboxylate transporter receptor subunit TctC
MGRHIPGKPSIVAQNRPGAGSVVLANQLYNKYPKDGSVVGMFSNSLHLWELLGQSNIKFTATKFNWIGRLTDADDIMAIRRDVGVKTFEDAKKKQLVIGVPGASSSPALMLTALNNVLGTKFKLVSGYPGSSGIRLAVERGELDGNQSLLWSVHKSWVQQNNFMVLYRVAAAKLEGLEGAPSLLELSKTDDQKKLIRFFTSYTDVGRSVVAPPGVPPDLVAALRAAFSSMVVDPQFIAEVEKSKLRLSPLSGEKLQNLIEAAFDLDDSLKKRARAAAQVRVQEIKKTKKKK